MNTQRLNILIYLYYIIVLHILHWIGNLNKIVKTNYFVRQQYSNIQPDIQIVQFYKI